jgi:hypothetical protein
MFQQKQVADCDSSIILRCESLKKLKKKFEVIEQINTAARMFITTVVEVVRRRAYNKDFVTWRNEVIQLARDAYCEETALRQKFKEMIGTHFVQCLFPGLSDKLATISAGQLPVFNHSLPEVTEDDLDELRAALPSLVECARVSEPQHWFSKMTDKMYDRDSKVEELATSKEEAVELRNEIKELMKELEEVKARGEQEKLELRNQLESSFHDQIQRLGEEKDHVLVESQKEWEKSLSMSTFQTEKTSKELAILQDRVVELEQQLSLTKRELKEKSELSIVLVERERTCAEESLRQKAQLEQEWQEKMEKERKEKMEEMKQLHEKEINDLIEQHKVKLSEELNELTTEWETKYTALENDLAELESNKSELEAKHKDNEHKLMSKLKGEYETRIATLQTENQQEIEIMRMKHDSMLKKVVGKGVESGRDEARKECELKMVELRKEIEKLMTELSEKEGEGKIAGVEEQFERERREWAIKNEELSKQIMKLQDRIKELEDTKVLETSTELVVERSQTDNEVGASEPDGKVNVSKELMEKERDLKEAQQEIVESKKMLESKDQVEKRLVKRSLELDAKCADLNEMVANLTRTLAAKGKIQTHGQTTDRQID